MARAKYTEWVTPEALQVIEGWRKRGLDLKEIAENMGISPSTLSVWQKEHPQIAEALKKGEAYVTATVENALYKSAVGYEYEEVTQELVTRKIPIIDNDTGEEIPGLFEEVQALEVTKKVKKTQAPNSTSIIFYLKNKLPELYRDRREQHLTGGIDMNNRGPDLSGIDTDDLKAVAEKLAASLEKSDNDEPR